MKKRLETLFRTTVTALKQEARLPYGLLDLVAHRMIDKVPGNPSGPLVRD
ncbi:MAG: hypothetical protein RLZZ09_654 [Pseudomonadota bacterium]|jgi:hypothetical protein